jgi:hypothetical protein
MAGRGKRPNPDQSQRHNPREKLIHEWQPTEGSGWQHGEIPKPPPGLLKASRDTWAVWMQAWFAAHWRPEDLPGLQHVIRLYDQVQRGGFQRSAELRLSMDTYGITPKGQQDRRWKPPSSEQVPELAPVVTPERWQRGATG